MFTNTFNRNQFIIILSALFTYFSPFFTSQFPITFICIYSFFSQFHIRPFILYQ